MHLEYNWGRRFLQYWDAEKVYGPKHHVLMRVVASKYLLESNTRKRWPAYVSHNEDLELRKPNRNEKMAWVKESLCWT